MFGRTMGIRPVDLPGPLAGLALLPLDVHPTIDGDLWEECGGEDSERGEKQEQVARALGISHFKSNKIDVLKQSVSQHRGAVPNNVTVDDAGQARVVEKSIKQNMPYLDGCFMRKFNEVFLLEISNGHLISMFWYDVFSIRI